MCVLCVLCCAVCAACVCCMCVLHVCVWASQTLTSSLLYMSLYACAMDCRCAFVRDASTLFSVASFVPAMHSSLGQTAISHHTLEQNTDTHTRAHVVWCGCDGACGVYACASQLTQHKQTHALTPSPHCLSQPLGLHLGVKLCCAKQLAQQLPVVACAQPTTHQHPSMSVHMRGQTHRHTHIHATSTGQAHKDRHTHTKTDTRTQ